MRKISKNDDLKKFIWNANKISYHKVKTIGLFKISFLKIQGNISIIFLEKVYN